MAGVTVDINANSKGFRSGMNRNKSFLARWAKSVTRKMATTGRAMGRRLVGGLVATVRRGAMVAGGLLVAGIGKSISEAGRFEAYEMQFEALLGSADKTAKRMQEIRDIDLEVPFDITGIADASRILTVFTNDAFASTEALRMMADAAAVTPNDIKDVAFWYGRAYSMIQAGRPFGEAAMRLQEMGLITGKARTEMEKLAKTKGPDSVAKMLGLLDAEFLKFEGSALKMAKTWKGITSIFSSATKQSFEAIGKEILPMAKVWLQELIDKMQALRKDGTLARWGQNIADAMALARTKLSGFFDFAVLKYEELKTAYMSGTLAQALGDEFDKAFTYVFNSIGNFIDEHMHSIIEYGVEIGMGLGTGIARGISRSKGGRIFAAVASLGLTEAAKVGYREQAKRDVTPLNFSNISRDDVGAMSAEQRNLLLKNVRNERDTRRLGMGPIDLIKRNKELTRVEEILLEISKSVETLRNPGDA